MEIQRKALYNSLRYNSLTDPSLRAEAWQVEDLRLVEVDELFRRISLDRETFMAMSENFDTPEDMTEELIGNTPMKNDMIDKIYLSVFELWRRLIPEKQSLSIFCDELDHQIHLYDTGRIVNQDKFHDVVDDLLVILNENADSGMDPQECMDTILQGSANDVEEFLYDYISDLLDAENLAYASDLVEGFSPYLEDGKWFDFLRLRLAFLKEGSNLHNSIEAFLKKVKGADVDFYFELLAFLSQHGDEKSYAQVSKKTLPLLVYEEDFTDFLSLTADFYHFLDDEKREKIIQDILKGRSKKPEAKFDQKDPSLQEVKKLIF
jgi:hypothetical protein